MKTILKWLCAIIIIFFVIPFFGMQLYANKSYCKSLEVTAEKIEKIEIFQIFYSIKYKNCYVITKGKFMGGCGFDGNSSCPTYVRNIYENNNSELRQIGSYPIEPWHETTIKNSLGFWPVWFSNFFIWTVPWGINVGIKKWVSLQDAVATLNYYGVEVAWLSTVHYTTLSSSTDTKYIDQQLNAKPYRKFQDTVIDSDKKRHYITNEIMLLLDFGKMTIQDWQDRRDTVENLKLVEKADTSLGFELWVPVWKEQEYVDMMKQNKNIERAEVIIWGVKSTFPNQ